MKTVTEDLIAAKSMIEDPAKWVKGSFAIVDRDTGACYCSLGALCEVVEQGPGNVEDEHPRYLAALGVLQQALPDYPHFISVAMFNDAEATTHQDVMDLFDRAIARSL